MDSVYHNGSQMELVDPNGALGAAKVDDTIEDLEQQDANGQDKKGGNGEVDVAFQGATPANTARKQTNGGGS